MALPQAVARKAERAAELMKPAQPATPAQPAAGDDATKLKQDLDATKKALDDVTQKYRSLQGTHKEQLELQNTIKSLKDQVADLQTKLDEKAAAAYELTEDERTNLGEQTVKVVGKIATGIVEATIKKHLIPLSERVDQFQRMNEAQYWATVDYFVPDFKAQNNDPKFMAWLKEIDPGTGQLRDDLLQRADAALMGYRVAEIFRAYKEGREIGARQTDNPPPTPNPADINPGPGSGNPQPIPDSSGKKQFTRTEIKDFYEDLKRNRGRMTKEQLAEARRTENEIFAARNEGRVVG